MHIFCSYEEFECFSLWMWGKSSDAIDQTANLTPQAKKGGRGLIKLGDGSQISRKRNSQR